MADPSNNDQRKPSTGRGSSILQMIKEAEMYKNRIAKKSVIPSTSLDRQETVPTMQKPKAELDVARDSVSALGRGRASLLSIKEPSEIGREKILLPGLVKKTITSTQPLMEDRRNDRRPPMHYKESSSKIQPLMAKQLTVHSRDDSGVLGSLSKLSVYETTQSATASSCQESQVISRQGTSGREVAILANYINLKLEEGKGLHQYEVKFNPDIDSIGLRRKLLNQHSAALGRTKSFDGSLLYLPQKLPEERTTYKSDHPVDGSPVILTVIFKKQQKMSENVQFFNVLLGRIMRALNLVRIGRQNFNPTCAHAVPQHRLEVWPGYVTAINEYEGGLKLCIDAKHRVMRMETVRDLM